MGGVETEHTRRLFMHILGVSGAHRAGDPSTTLLLEAAEAARTTLAHKFNHVQTDIVRLWEVTESFHTGDYLVPKWAEPLLSKFREADGVILSSPVYGGTMAPIMSNFLDLLYSLERRDTSNPLDGTLVGYIAHGHTNGGKEVCLDMHAICDDCGMCGFPRGMFYQLDEGKDRSENKWQLTDHVLLGRNLAQAIMNRHFGSAFMPDWQLRY